MKTTDNGDGTYTHTFSGNDIWSAELLRIQEYIERDMARTRRRELIIKVVLVISLLVLVASVVVQVILRGH